MLAVNDREQGGRAGMRRMRAPWGVVSALIMLVLQGLAGCASFGPGSVGRDRFDYSEAVADSWKNQMLLNLVKLRYGDTPVFLDVGQVISSYTVQSSFSALGSAFNTSGVVPGVPNSSVSLGAQGQFIDRPTITYAPLAGERFARALMTPIPPPALMSLIEGGYPVDMVLRLATNGVNGVHNRFGGDLRVRPADPEFYELVARLRRIQLSGAIGIRVKRTQGNEAMLLTFRQKLEPSVAADSRAVRQSLGLDPGGGEFRIVYGATAADDKEIAILSRSVLQILLDLASFITVPEAHVADHRVTPTAEPESGPEGPVRPLIRISNSVERPTDAFVTVPYRGYWFWIDDRDLPSKRLFTFMHFIFALTETTGSKEGLPVVTIPTS